MPINQVTDPIAEAVERVDLHELHRLVQAYTYLGFEHRAEANRLERLGRLADADRQLRRAAHAESRALRAYRAGEKLITRLGHLALRFRILAADARRVAVVVGVFS